MCTRRLNPAIVGLSTVVIAIASIVAPSPAAPATASAPSTSPADDSVDAVVATEFEARRVYESSHRPGYTSWVSFFPGERGQWYLTCEELSIPAEPLAPVTPQAWYEMGLPTGYDKSFYQMEVVMLESRDQLASWKVIRREPVRFQHSAGSFGQARTRDGRFLRFLWSCYSLDASVQPNEIFYQSEDDGQTWKKMPPFHHPRFASHPHRLRTLRDGTLVLAVPFSERWGGGLDRPTRTAQRLDVANHMQMTLYFSFDDGRSWKGPLPVFGGQNVSETDFVELPSGDLLLVNNSIFAYPGRQILYRKDQVFTPGPLERVGAGRVPETICLTSDGLLVGCMRAGSYGWSDDLGKTWTRLAGVPGRGPEMYQPWIQALPDGRIACAGHFGYDDAPGKRQQYISLHLFRLERRRHTADTKLELVRDFDAAAQRWPNRYTLRLTSEGSPLAGREVEIWYVEKGKPGHDSWQKHTLSERMADGGHRLVRRTDASGVARVELPEFDAVRDPHVSYQLIARFNADGAERSLKPAQTPQFNFYAWAEMTPPPAP